MADLFPSRLSRALTRFRDEHAEATVLHVLFFLIIADNPGITQRKLYAMVGTNDSVSSRTIGLLGDQGSRTYEGLKLVAARRNPLDNREWLLELTPKGQRLLADMKRDMGN